jgi:hypothetical protein
LKRLAREVARADVLILGGTLTLLKPRDALDAQVCVRASVGTHLAIGGAALTCITTGDKGTVTAKEAEVAGREEVAGAVLPASGARLRATDEIIGVRHADLLGELAVHWVERVTELTTQRHAAASVDFALEPIGAARLHERAAAMLDTSPGLAGAEKRRAEQADPTIVQSVEAFAQSLAVLPALFVPKHRDAHVPVE